MTIKPISGLLIVATISLVSCKKEETAEKNTADQKPVPSVYEIVNGTNVSQQPVQPQQNMTVTPTQTTTTVTPPAQPVVAKGMNPAHGQPGHRCDIPVGAPLNSPPGKPTPPQGVTQAQKTNSQNFTVTPTSLTPTGNTTTSSQNSAVPELLSTPTTETAPGMNPPHGQAGHRCDIAVGAPLPKS
ncbi:MULTISPECIES: hypothetical protein [Flavobacterium]|uniref:hypothetical protein n=1 Tax=Flavobacterium TaxID=237 RepID=UPI001FCC8C5E|nr:MULTISPECIES: hypothetical protein [Flavobacterium]UOK42931.1 hypothetical protein LZF87_02125 [Flavobacterium enshiense]